MPSRRVVRRTSGVWRPTTFFAPLSPTLARPPEQYESRIRAMEAEREAMAAAASRSAEVERYKELLLKQRDIMIALTARLNERDDNIVALQVGVHTIRVWIRSRRRAWVTGGGEPVGKAWKTSRWQERSL